MKPVSFASIGECMIELSAGKGDLWRMGFAGDTFNTAWYARATLPRNRRVGYVTALGDDPFSDRHAEIHRQGGHRDRPHPRGSRPAAGPLCDHAEESRARLHLLAGRVGGAAFSPTTQRGLRSALSGVDVLYFSGITLAILAEPARKTAVRRDSQGGASKARASLSIRISAPRSGPTRQSRARRWKPPIASPTSRFRHFPTRPLLFGDRSVRETAKRLLDAGVGEFVIKNGDKPAIVFGDGVHGASSAREAAKDRRHDGRRRLHSAAPISPAGSSV